MLRFFLKPVAIFPPKWIKKSPDFLGHDFSDFFEIFLKKKIEKLNKKKIFFRVTKENDYFFVRSNVIFF